MVKPHQKLRCLTPEGAAGAEYGRAGTETVKKAVRGVEEEPAIPLAHQYPVSLTLCPYVSGKRSVWVSMSRMWLECHAVRLVPVVSKEKGLE